MNSARWSVVSVLASGPGNAARSRWAWVARSAGRGRPPACRRGPGRRSRHSLLRCGRTANRAPGIHRIRWSGLHGVHANCKTCAMARLSEPSPTWSSTERMARARMSTPLKVDRRRTQRLRGLRRADRPAGGRRSLLPLARLIHLQVAAVRACSRQPTNLGEPRDRTRTVRCRSSWVWPAASRWQVHHRPGVAGLLSRWDDHPRVDLVTTDGLSTPTPN